MHDQPEDTQQRRPASRRVRDFTQGSIVRNLMALSWPMIIANSINMIGPTVDMIWVGKLGSADIAGVGVAGMVVMLVQSGLMGLFTGLRAMIARFIGAGDERQANYAAQQAYHRSRFFHHTCYRRYLLRRGNPGYRRCLSRSTGHRRLIYPYTICLHGRHIFPHDDRRCNAGIRRYYDSHEDRRYIPRPPCLDIAGIYLRPVVFSGNGR